MKGMLECGKLARAIHSVTNFSENHPYSQSYQETDESDDLPHNHWWNLRFFIGWTVLVIIFITSSFPNIGKEAHHSNAQPNRRLCSLSSIVLFSSLFTLCQAIGNPFSSVKIQQSWKRVKLTPPPSMDLDAHISIIFSLWRASCQPFLTWYSMAALVPSCFTRRTPCPFGVGQSLLEEMLL